MSLQIRAGLIDPLAPFLDGSLQIAGLFGRERAGRARQNGLPLVFADRSGASV